MSVTISCCREIARSRSFSLRMLAAAEDSDTDLGDSDERQRDSACLRPPQIYIAVSSSSSPPFHLSISLYPGLLTLIAASFLYDWEIYNPISTAPCPWLGPPRMYTHAAHTKHKKTPHSNKTHTCACSRKQECVQSLIELTCECFFSTVCMSPCVKALHMRKSSAGRVDVLGAAYLRFYGLFNSCKELNRMLPLPHFLILPA